MEFGSLLLGRDVTVCPKKKLYSQVFFKKNKKPNRFYYGEGAIRKKTTIFSFGGENLDKLLIMLRAKNPISHFGAFCNFAKGKKHLHM